MQNIIERYFEAWNAGDLQTLSMLMHEDVQLRDWSNEVSGHDAVIMANSKIFDQFPEAQIEIISIASYKENKVFAQLQIYLTLENKIDVVDIFEIKNDRITKITAYKV